jgi:hypothetical protein
MKINLKILLSLLVLNPIWSEAKDNISKDVPLFKENKGQLADQNSKPRSDIHYYGSSDGLSYFFKNTGISYQLYEKGKKEDEFLVSRVDMTWVGANANAKVITKNTATSTDNFYNTTKSDGVTGVRSFGDLQYEGIYQGIDLHYYYKDGSLKYDFIVAPGANYKNIQIKIEGSTSIRQNGDGTISIATPNGILTEGMPVAYQGNKEVRTNWILEGNVLSFQLADYDATLPLIIDPLVYQWTRTEGIPSGVQQVIINYYRSVCDPYGNSYVVANKQGTSPNSTATYLNKYSNALGNTIWSKSQYTPAPTINVTVEGLALYGNDLYMCGRASTVTTLATTGAYQTTLNGNSDGFLIKMDTSGTKIWGTYYGGILNDAITNCKVDSAGFLFVCGTTSSSTNIANATAQQTALAGLSDAFVGKFNTSNGYRAWATYYGGAAADSAKSLEVRGNRLYIAGNTKSNSGIATAGAHQTAYGGNINGFLLCMDTSGITQWSTYYGADSTYAENCVLTSDAVYISGSTSAATNIATAGTFQPAIGGAIDGFLAKFNLSGVRQWGTYYGGSSVDLVHAAVATNNGRIYIGGNTKSTTGISTPYAYNPTFVTPAYTMYDQQVGVAFIGELDVNGQRVSGTYFNAGTMLEHMSTNNTSDLFVSGLAIMDMNDYASFFTRFDYCNSPAPVISASATNICGNSSVQLSSPLVPGTSYQWYRNDILISGATANTYNATLAGTYMLQINQCPTGTSSTIVLTASPLPTTSITKVNAPCPTAPTGSITVTPSGATAPYSYVWANSSSTSATRTGLVPGAYIVTTADANSCAKTDTVTILNTNSGPTTAIAKTDAPCAVATNGSITVTPSGGTAPYSYIWDNSTNITATLSGLIPGSYIVHTSDVNTCTKTDTVTILNTNNSPSSQTSHTNVPCYGDSVATITVTTTNGTTPYSYAWDNLPNTTSYIDGLTTGTYVVHTSDINNCSDVDTVIIEQNTTTSPSDPLASICAVTVDSATGKNMVIWQKTGIVNATAYNIYRESIVAGQYDLIGTNDVNDITTFLDVTSVPLQQSYSYKIAEVDSCDHEWPLSDLHKTIHLSANVGTNGEINLSWNVYEGKPYTTHRIWRSFNGAPFALLNEVSSTITAYSDLTPPIGNNVYRIQIDLGAVCDSINAQFVTSNKLSLSSTAINDVPGANAIQIMPNPTTGIINILGNVPAKIQLYDAVGRLLLEERNVSKLDISRFSKGIYMIRLSDKSGQLYYSQKVLLK